MAFPVQESNTTYVQPSNTVTHTLTYPTGIQAGDLLVYFFSSDGGTHTTTWPGSGWVNALDQAGDGDSHYFGWGYKKATGSETGNLPPITLSSAQRASGAVFRFSDAADPDVTPPENGAIQVLAATTSPNSPPVTPTVASLFPVLESASITPDAANTTNHLWTYPSGIQAGDLLIGLLCLDSGTAPTQGPFPAGWVEVSEDNFHISAAALTGYKWADGTETGTFTTTSSNNNQATTEILRISGADPNINPQFVKATTLGGSPNSPNLVPTGGAKDYLWLSIEGHDSADSINSYPANMTGAQGTGTSGTSGTRVSYKAHNLNAASFDPDTYVLNGSEASISWTIAVHPAPPTTTTDYGFLAALGVDSDSFATVFPSNMTTGPEVDVRHTQSTGAGCFFDFHTVNTTSFDPTAWALNSAEESIAFTIAIHPAPIPTGALLDQDSYRAYNDGTESGAVAKAAINAIFDQPVNEIFQLRYLVQQTFASATTDLTSVVKPQFRINGGSWSDVGAIPTAPSPPMSGSTTTNIDVEPEFPRNVTDITWNNDGTIAYVTGDTGGASQPMETTQYVCSTPYDFTTKAAASGTFQWSNASSQWTSRMLWDAKGYKAVQFEMSTGPTTAEFIEYDAGGTTVAISAITQANPGVFTTATHSLTTDDVILIKNVGGMVEVNDTYYKVVVTGATTFTLKDDDTDVAVDTTGFTAYTTGGTIQKITPYDVTVLATNGVTKDITADISFDFTFGAQMWRYNNDGTTIYAIDHATSGNTTVKEYALSTAYDLSSMSTTLVQSIALPADKESRAYHDFDFSQSGNRVTWVYEGATTAEYAEYTLSVAYDLSTIAAANTSVFVDNLAVVDGDDGPRSISFAANGERVYTAFAVNTASTVDLYIRQFDLDLGTSTAVQFADSTFLTDGGATTQRLGAGSFVAGEIGESGTQTVTWSNPSTSEETEFLYALLLDGVQVSRMDAVEVRLVHSDDSLLNLYSATAQMSASGPIEAGAPGTLNFTGLEGNVDVGIGVTETALTATAFNFTGLQGSFISPTAVNVTSSAPDTLNFPGGILPSILDAAQTNIGAVDAETDSYSITVSSGSNRMLVVFVAYEWDDADAMAPSTVAFNTSESLTLLSSASIVAEESTFNLSLDTWYLLNPTATTANLDVTLTGTFSGGQIATSAIVVENVKQSAPSPTFEGASPEFTDPTTVSNTNTNYTTDSLILDAVALAGDVDPTAGASQTELFDVSVSTSSVFRLAGSSLPAVPTSGDPEGATGPMSWTFASVFRAAYVQIGLESVVVPTALPGSLSLGHVETAAAPGTLNFTGLAGNSDTGWIETAASATAFDFTGLQGNFTSGIGVIETSAGPDTLNFTGIAGNLEIGAAPIAASATAFDFTGLQGSSDIGWIETAAAAGTLNFTGLQATLTIGDNPFTTDISGNVEFSGNIEITIE